jgi:hypothetical protein
MALRGDEPRRGTGSIARVIRGLAAVAILVALVVNYADATRVAGFRAINFFSYFTILSNVLALGLLAGQALRPGWMGHNARFRGAVSLYMTATLLVYAVLLRPIAADVGNYRPWIDYIEHTAAPVLVLQDWLLFPPRRRLPASWLWGWMVFPVVYLAYSLIRGPGAGWYPYPFLDPTLDGGYPRVALYVVVIALVFVGIGSLIRWWPGYAAEEPT